jgi:hypothetical protein
MFKVSREKVKIGDEQNREALRNIDPKQPFHVMGLAGRNCLGQELELIRNSAVMLSETKHLWPISIPHRFRCDPGFFASLRMTRCFFSLDALKRGYS